MESILQRSVSALFKFRFSSFRRMVPQRYFAVDDDGDLSQFKTTVTVLNQEQDRGIFIDSYSNMGFMLNTGMRVFGPCAIFPRSILHWNVRGVEDINEDSLSLFTMLEPKIDILVLGVGERENLRKIDGKIMKHLRAKKINVELLPTDQALATFNFLNAEKRYVAGAFIPPSYVENMDDDDIFTNREFGKMPLNDTELPEENESYLTEGEKGGEKPKEK